MNVTGPGSFGGLQGLDPRVLRLLAETLIEGAAREPSGASATAPADRLTVSFDALTAAPLQHLLHTIEQRLFPLAAPVENVSAPAAAVAKDAALKSVEKATQAIAGGGGVHGARIPENLDAQTVLALATRMIETQQYPNYLRAAELGNTIVTWYEGAIPDVPLARTTRVEVRARGGTPAWPGAVRKLWRRAPLLVLLGGWLLAGIAGALLIRSEFSPLFTVWALGFPALIVLQFLLTIRGFRK
ncbi:MAG TPA: hypothetical protein VHC90_23835 [Bryobacteraceae bacterium]|nr:hypothetical protein [Bryobacteraceae bacterium]